MLNFSVSLTKSYIIATLVLAVIGSLPLVNCQSAPLPSMHEFREQFIERGKRVMIDGITETAGIGQRSSKWKFNTTQGDNLSFSIVQDHFQLGPDCSGNKEAPIVEVIIFPDDSQRRNVFPSCTGRSVHSLVSSNNIEIVYRNINPNGTFMFVVTAKFAGYMLPSIEEKNRYVPSRSFAQWIAFHKDEGSTYIMIRITKLKVIKSNKATNCKKAYLNVFDNQNNLLKSICNNDESYDKELLIKTEALYVNVTFKKADFFIAARPSNDSKERFTSTVLIPTVWQGEDETTGPTAVQAGEGSGKYMIIGLVVAVVIVLIPVVFIIWKLRRHKQAQRNRRESNKPLDAEMSTYTSGTTLSLPPYRPHSINNAMYERIVSGNRNPVNIHEISDNHSDQNRSAQLSSIEKRQQRLSQLADKYIDIELPSKSNATDAKESMASTEPNIPPANPRKRSQLNTAEEATASRSFYHVRPPIPLPCSPPKGAHTVNTYEPFNPQLTEADLASPGYATIDDPVQEATSGTKFLFPSQKGIPVGEYTTSGELQQVSKGLPQAFYISTESLIESVDSSQSCQIVPPQPQVNISEKDYLKEGKDGYLSLTSSKNIQPFNQISYVTENAVSDKNLPLHPKLENTTSSMPNLLQEEAMDINRVNITPPKAAPRKLAGKNGKQNEQTHSLQQSQNASEIGDLRNVSRYKHPRPSVPDIFLQCAYTSGDDVTQIQNRLRKIAAKAGNSDPPGCSGPLEIPATGEGFLYDSPRPSLCCSNDGLLDKQSVDFYDTPRPSLPNIFPEEMQQFLEKTRLNERS